MPTPSSAVAYSYVRFSHPSQAEGDSLRRQTEAAQAWCERNGVHLDAGTTLHDLGRSAYTGTHRTNPDRHALAAFLKLVESGKVPRGSYLIIENLDRLSREHIQPALLLALNLLQAGIRIVQLKPAEMVFDDKSDTLPVMMMMMELSRGHGESAIKSERVCAAWAEKKRRAREGECQRPTTRMGEGRSVITRKLPAWVKLRDGELVLVPERAAVVERIFALAIAGYGQPAIVKRLTADGVPGFGWRGRWGRTYIAKVLGDRRALGEFQPRRRDGTPDGDPIPNYYPAVVSEGEWAAAKAGAAQRRKRPGGLGRTCINVFAGLLRNARDGDTYYLTTRTNRPRSGQPGATNRVLVNSMQTEGLARAYSYPFDVFEAAMFAQLAEVDPREVLGQEGGGPNEVMALSGELAAVEAKIAELEAELLNGDVAALARVLREQEARKVSLTTALAQARQKAASPLSEAWGEAKSLLATVNDAPDPVDARLRLRSAIRRMVDSVWLLVVPRGRDRLAAVQVWFVGGERHRDYLVFSRPPKANAKARREGKWWARSLATDAAPEELDLRKPDHAAKLAEALATADLADFGIDAPT